MLKTSFLNQAGAEVFRAPTLKTTEKECHKLDCFKASFPTGKQQQPPKKTPQTKTKQKPHQG